MERQTYNGIIENDIVFDDFEIVGFEATGLVSVAVLYDEFEVTSNGGKVSFDGQVKVVEDFTNMEMRLSRDIIAATENQEKPVRSHTDEDIAVDLSLGLYMSGSWVIEGSDDSSISAYFDTDGNGLEYSVNGADSQLIPWSGLQLVSDSELHKFRLITESRSSELVISTIINSENGRNSSEQIEGCYWDVASQAILVPYKTL